MRSVVVIFALCLSVLLISVAVAQDETGTHRSWFKDRRIMEEKFSRGIRLAGSMQVQQKTEINSFGPLSVIGRWAWGSCTTVELAGHFALVGQGFVYQVFDISVPGSSTLVYDTTLTEPIQHIEIKDSTLFIVLSGSVLLCDAGSIFPLVKRGSLNLSAGLLRDVAVSDTLLFVIADGVGLLSYSIADQTHPYFLTPYPVVSQFGVGSVASKGPYVYYGSLGGGEILHILEYVRDSSSFRTKGLSVGGSPQAAKVYDTLLAIGAGFGNLNLFSIVDPWNPVLLGSVSIKSPIGAIAKRDNRIYCSTQDSGLIVVDISTPAIPRITTKHQSANSSAGTLAVRDSILAASGAGLKLYVISSPDQVNDCFFYPTGGDPIAIQMRGDIGFVASGSAGLWSVDFSDPAHPRPIENLRIGYAGPLALTRSLACYLAGPAPPIPERMIVANASDSGSLSFLSATDLGISEVQSIAAMDSTVFVGFTDSVVAYKLTNPLSPQRLWSWSLHNLAANQVTTSGNNLYVAQPNGYDNGGLRILNVENADSPRVIASLLHNVYGVFVSDSIAVAIADTGLCVFNVSDPANPALIGMAQVVGSSPISGNRDFAFVTTNSIIDVFDLSTASRPTLVGSAPEIQTGQVDCLVSQGDRLFVSAPFSGIWILKNNLVTGIRAISSSLPEAYQLFQNYPNPFNPSTTIKYSTPTGGPVNLRIFDLLGRQVANLDASAKLRGTYTIFWNAVGQASGVYFCRLQAGSFVSVRKMILLK